MGFLSYGMAIMSYCALSAYLFHETHSWWALVVLVFAAFTTYSEKGPTVVKCPKCGASVVFDKEE